MKTTNLVLNSCAAVAAAIYLYLFVTAMGPGPLALLAVLFVVMWKFN